MDIDYKYELRNFLNGDGKLKNYPSKHKYKILALFYLSLNFKKGVTYSEKQVNELIDESHLFGDRCLLRRELYNKKFLGRTDDCSEYWLEESQPKLQEFISRL